MSATKQKTPKSQSSSATDASGILQASTTIAALAVAFAAFVPQIPAIKSTATINFADRQFSVVVLLLLFCGLLSLSASISCIRELQQARPPSRSLLSGALGLLNVALVLSGVGYIVIIWSIS